MNFLKYSDDFACLTWTSDILVLSSVVGELQKTTSNALRLHMALCKNNCQCSISFRLLEKAYSYIVHTEHVKISAYITSSVSDPKRFFRIRTRPYR